MLDEDGKPLESQATLNDPDEVIKTVPNAWWSAAWDSMELAGNPPPPEEEPADLIDGTGSSDASTPPTSPPSRPSWAASRAPSTPSGTAARAATPTS